MSMSIKELLALFSKETLATLYMVSISTVISYAIGIPLGVILVVTEEGGVAPNKIVHGILGFFTNIFRTIPFLILLVMVLPLTKLLVKTTLGPKAIIPPLVLLPEARPSLYVGAAICMTSILSYSAMAGFVGGGGLGAIALNYGYYRYQTDMMLIAVVVLVVIVQLVQEFWMRLAKYSDKRGKLN